MKKRLFFMLALLMSAFNGWAQEVVIDKIHYSLFERNGVMEAQVSGTDEDISEVNIQTQVNIGGKDYAVTKIANLAFWGRQFTRIDIPEGIVTIDFDAFDDMQALKYVTIPSSVTELGEAWCTENEIESITVHENNPVFDSRENCNGIIRTADNMMISIFKNTVIPNSVTGIAYRSLRYSIETLNLPASVSYYDGWATIDAKFQYIAVDEANPYFYVKDNCLIEKGSNFLVTTGSATTRIPDEVIGFGNLSLINFSGSTVYLNDLYPITLRYSLGADNTTLQVPDGTIPRYLYQGWGNAFKRITDGTTTYYCRAEGDTWFAPHIDVLTAKAGEEVDLSVVLNADRPVVGFQFDLYLPDGVAVTTDDEGYEDIYLSTTRTTTRKHELTAQQQADGSWRVLCYSNSNYSFEGNEGEVCTIRISTSSDLNGQGYPIILRNVVTSYLNNDGDVEQSERDELTSYINLFTPEPLLFGDANGDEKVNVTDIATIVSYIMGRTPSQFVFGLADAYPDGQINVSDITATVSIILNSNSQQQAPRRRILRSPDAQVSEETVTANLEVIPFAIAPGEEKEVEVVLNNPDDDFTGLQFDLVLPSGIELVSDEIGYLVDLGSRTTSRKHTIEAALQGDGSVRVMAYSNRNSNFSGNEGDVVILTLKADDNQVAGVYNLQLKNIVLSQAVENDINQVEPADYEGSILSGIIAENPVIKGDITAEAAIAISGSVAENVTSINLTQAIAVAEDAEFSTTNPNTLILAPASTKNINKNVIAGDVCADLVLSDVASFATPNAFTATKVTLYRTINANSYATVAVPFALDETQIKTAFGNDATVYTYNDGTEVGDAINLTFKAATSIEANVPFLVLTSSAQTTLIFNNVEVATGIPVKTESNVSFYGNYNGQITLPENYFFIAQNKLFRSTGNSHMSGFRAYLAISGASVKEVNLNIDGQATSISEVSNIANIEDIYDLQGRKVLRMNKGVYVSNGKKMIK